MLQALFLLPASYPVTTVNLNWTPITVGIVLILVLVAWFLPKYGARHWYRGKAHTLDDAVIVRLLPLPGCPLKSSQPALLRLHTLAPCVTVLSRTQRIQTNADEARMQVTDIMHCCRLAKRPV